MEKNPVSYLQEYMIKTLKITPNYTIISQSVGTHVNSFTIRVSCKELTTEGSGSSKKEAKLNAALNMIDLLQIQSSTLSKSYCLSKNNIPNTPIELGESSPNSFLLMSPSTSSINHIGKLQEYAVLQQDTLPIYELTNVSGLSHKPEFIVICKYKEHQIIAKGNSKKEAKSLAAQKMYEKVYKEPEKNFDSDTKVKSYIDTVMKEMEQMQIFKCNKHHLEQSAEKALEHYNKLGKSETLIANISSNNCKNYHLQLRKKFSAKDREIVINKLEDVIIASKNSSVNEEQNPMTLLQMALNFLNVNMKVIEYASQHDSIIYSLKVQTEPIINEIGYGKNKTEAQLNAINLTAATLILMLL